MELVKYRDPVLMEVIGNGFVSIAEEMSVTLQRTAYSSIVREALDFSTAIFDATGALLAQSENIPTHLGAMSLTLQEILEHHFTPEKLYEGDQIIINNPYLGASHTPDITIFCPVFMEGELVGFCGSMCHHVDVGGSAPGSLANNVTDIYQEGLLIPPLKLYEKGVPNEAIFALIQSNIRMPSHTMGDLRAQISANIIGKKRLIQVFEKYGISTVRDIIKDLLHYTEHMIRLKINEIPNGVYEAEGHLDDDGVKIDNRIPLKVKIEVIDDNTIFDFTECSPQTRGPVNAVWTMAWSVACYITRCVSDSYVQQNEGAFRPIDVRLKKGTIMNPEAPAPVGARYHTIMRISDLCLEALAPALPHLIPAGSNAHATSISIGGIHPETQAYFVYFELNGGGMGARPNKDGLSGIDVHVGNCMNVPVEAAELEYPLQFIRYELIPDSGGAGKYRGGLGFERTIKVLSDGLTLTIRSDAETTAPKGLIGGLDGLPGSKWINPGTTIEQPLYRKATRYQLKKGDVIQILTPGSGGHGSPLERDRASVMKDFLDGYITKDSLMNNYKVIL